MYFGREVDQAIIQYNNSEDSIEKERIYNSIIYPALNKLVEHNIYKHINQKTGIFYYGINSYTDLKHEFVIHLTNQLFRYTLDKGNSFSYFNRININSIYGFLNDLTQTRKIKGIEFESDRNDRIDLNVIDRSRNLTQEVYQEEVLDELKDFCDRWSNWGNLHLDFLFLTKREKQIANAIFTLFKDCEQIDIYNKKALYILIREQVDVKTQYITDVIKVLKNLHKKMYQEFKKNGTKNWSKFLIIEEED